MREPFYAYFAPYGWMAFYGTLMQWRRFRRHKAWYDQKVRGWHE